ncbi:MAG TPA: M90 family metallopeptidase [Rectinemataceae bacterium]|nr:M90 family metallopeptidase [Rectinemataceae bacterium]
MGLFGKFREARRRRILERQPISDELWAWALDEHRIFHWLGDDDRVRLRELATVFLGEKIFDPVGGVVLEDETKVSIAAQACLPLLGLGMDWYNDWSTIIVTPREYDVRTRNVDEAGVVHEYDDEFAGEAFDLGPVALSRADVEASGWGDGYNVVIHEMAHKLDGRDGAFNGCPPLRPGMDVEAWGAIFRSAFEDFRARVEAPASPSKRRHSHGRKGTRMDEYAAESPDEFFAVCCEYFYERPALLRSEYPEVYGQLARFFDRDPLAA